MTKKRQHLIALREKKGLKPRALAEITNINYSTIYKLEADKNRQPSGEVLKKLAQFYGVSTDYILHGKTSNASILKGKLKIIPVIGIAQAGAWNEALEILPEDHMEYVLCDMDGHPNTIAVKITGTSMEPKVMDGQVIYVDTDMLTPESGKLVLAQQNGDEATFKQYIIDGGKVLLVPLNPQYPTLEVNESCRIIGTIWGKTTVIEKI